MNRGVNSGILKLSNNQMKPTEILQICEGNYNKCCNVTLKNRAIIPNRILIGTRGNDYGDFYLVISEGKSEKPISALDIESIEVLD